MDTNERSTNPTLHTEMQLVFNSKLRVVNLDFGDYAIPLATGLLLIERKKPGDFLNSISDGRIFKQVEGMQASSHWTFCVIHGSLLYNRNDRVVADGRETHWSGASVRGALRSIQLAGCTLEMVPSGGFIRAIQEIVKAVSKEDHIHLHQKRSITFRDVTMSDREREEYKSVEFIGALPSIGRKKAEALLAYTANGSKHKWGTVADALMLITQLGVTKSIPSELREHWGKLTLKRVREFIGLPENKYLTSAVNKSPLKKGTSNK